MVYDEERRPERDILPSSGCRELSLFLLFF